MKNIVVALDFSEATEPVLETASSLAHAFSAKVWLIHVAAPEPDFMGYSPGPQTVRDAVAEELREEHRTLQKYAERLRADGLDTTALLVQGPTVHTLLAEAHKLEADHIVIASHGYGAFFRVILGSVSEGVVHKARCPVTIVRPNGPGPEKEA